LLNTLNVTPYYPFLGLRLKPSSIVHVHIPLVREPVREESDNVVARLDPAKQKYLPYVRNTPSNPPNFNLSAETPGYCSIMDPANDGFAWGETIKT
jgi:hypothetical protein